MSGKGNEFVRFVLPVKSEISRIMCPHLFYNWIFFKQKRIFLEAVFQSKWNWTGIIYQTDCNNL